MIKTFCPGSTCPRSRRACSAVEPEMATAAACSNVRFAGFRRKLVLASAGVLREGTRSDAEHLIAGPEPSHILTDRLHNPGHIHARDAVLGRTKPIAREAYRVRQPGHDMPHPTVHTGRMHAHQHLVVGHLGLVDLPELETIRRAVGDLYDRLHELSLLTVPPRGIGCALLARHHLRSHGTGTKH